MSQPALVLCATLLWGSLAAVILAAPAILPVLLFDEFHGNRRRPRRNKGLLAHARSQIAILRGWWNRRRGAGVFHSQRA